jgi:hypothetical protein
MQMESHGHPLSPFSGESAPDQTSGEGFGGIWHGVMPSLTEKLTLTHLETTAKSLHEAALKSLPEDRRLEVRTHRAAHPEKLALGALTITWQNGR